MKANRLNWSDRCSCALTRRGGVLIRGAAIQSSIIPRRSSVHSLAVVGGLLVAITALGARAQPCTPPPSDMVAWYTGDDCGPGDLLVQHNGTFVGLPVCSLHWKVGGGAMAFFPAPATYVTVPSAADLNFGTGDFSIEVRK